MRLNKKMGKRKSSLILSSVSAIVIFLCGNYFINIMAASMQNKFDDLFSIKKIFILDIAYAKDNKFIMFFYILLIIMDAIYSISLAYRIRTSYAEMNIGQKGTSRFTTVQEIKEQYKEVSDKDKEFDGYGGIPVARIGDKLYLDDSNTNTSILGITRSGKGEMFIVPCIDLYSRGKKKASMINIDMKMELICRSYDTLKKRGYDVLFLNIEDPSMGVQFNPLDLIVKYYMSGNKSDAELLCNSFAYSIYSGKGSNGDDNAEFFLNNATSALSALIIAHIDDCDTQDKRENAKVEIEFIRRQHVFKNLDNEEKSSARNEWNVNKPLVMTLDEINKFNAIPDDETFKKTHENLKKVTVSSIVNTFTALARQRINQSLTQLDVYFQKRPEGDRAKAIYSSIELAGGEKTKGSIFSQALTKLNIYMYENIKRLTAKSSFDIESLGFGDKPVALFIGVPFYDRSKDSIVSTLIGQIFQANARRASIEPGQKCKRKIIFQLDEIGNYPAIKDFKSMVTVGLGCNMIFNLAIQDYNQLKSTYGEDALTIEANCGNQVYIQTASGETAEKFSKMLGNETITNITRTGKKMELSKSFTELYEERPLLNSRELMNLMPGENVVFRAMKRIDLKGNKVVPYPILNSIGRGTNFLFSYEYLNDTFPSNKSLRELSLPQVNDQIPEYFNYNLVMNKFAFEYVDQIIKSGNQDEIDELSQDQLIEYEKFKRFYKYDMPLNYYSYGKALISFAQKHDMNVNENTTLGGFIEELDANKINIDDKESVLSIISKE